MKFHAESVSASAAGDYYQIFLGPKEDEDADPFDVRGPYVLVQRQFEMPNGGRSGVETHDEDYIGEFKVRVIELSQTKLAFEIKRKTKNHIEVTYTLDSAKFEKFRHLAEIVFGLKEPGIDGEDDYLSVDDYDENEFDEI